MISSEGQEGPNIARITLICAWTFEGISILAVGLAQWHRHIHRIPLGADFYLTILALLTSIALVTQTTWAILDEGMDEHQSEVQKTKFAVVVRSLLVNETLWGLVNTFVRVSSVLLLKAVFGPLRIMWVLTTLLVLSILYGLAVLLEVFLICRPMAANWNTNVDGTCGNQIASYLVLEAIGLLLDFAILVVPSPAIWRLNMSWRRKVGVTVVFSIGVLLFIVTGLRLQALHLIDAADFSYSQGYLGLLSALGSSLGIAFCCAPAVLVIITRSWRSRQGLWKMIKSRIAIKDYDSTTYDDVKNDDFSIPVLPPEDLRKESPLLPPTDCGLLRNQGTRTRWSVEYFDESWLESYGLPLIMVYLDDKAQEHDGASKTTMNPG